MEQDGKILGPQIPQGRGIARDTLFDFGRTNPGQPIRPDPYAALSDAKG